MKKLILTTAALVALVASALAECDAPFPASLFEERADGTNCPVNDAGTCIGGTLAAIAIFVATSELAGADSVGHGSFTAELGAKIAAAAK
jgi:hypothetical protein